MLAAPQSAEATDKYWVGGSGNWSDTGHWSLTSGGSNGASVPSSSDDVFINGSSGGGTVTVNTSATTKSLILTGFTGSFTGSSALDIAGSLTLPASGLGFSYNGALSFSSTSTGNTITLNGATVNSTATFNGVGGGWTLQDAWTSSFNIVLTAGALNTNGKTVSVAALTSTGSVTRSLTLGASQITVGTWTVDSTNMTLSAGTSIITLSTTGASFAGGDKTYYELDLPQTTTNSIAPTISGANTFAIIKRTNASGLANLVLAADQTITTSLEITGNNANTQRLFVYSDTPGITRTINVGSATVSLTNVDFQDIALSGSSAPYSGTSLGDGGGNSGITFTPAATRYWVGGTGNWSSTTHWSTTSGGSSGASMPILQDTAIFDANSFSSSSQIVSGNASGPIRYSSMVWTGVTNNPTWAVGATSTEYLFGSVTLDPGMSLSGAILLELRTRTNSTITSAGKLWPVTMTINSPGGTYTSQDDFSTTSSPTLTLTRGTFDANNHNVTSGGFSSNNTNVRTLRMGSGLWNMQGTNNPWNINGTNFTLDSGTSTIKLTRALTANPTFTGGGLTYYNFWNATTNNFFLTIVGSNTFNEFKIDPGRIVRFTAGTTTTVASFNAIGTSGSPITITSPTAATHTLTKSGGGTISGEYLTISYSSAGPSSTWYAGTNSTDGGNNSGWNFTDVPTPTPTPTSGPTPTPTPTSTPGSGGSSSSSSTANPCPGFVVCPNVNASNNNPSEKTETVSGGGGSSVGELIIPPDSSSIDLKVYVAEQNPANLTSQENPIPFPWQQGLNTVSEIFNFSAVSAFNGYPVTSLENPAIVLFTYDPAKLNGRSSYALRIAYYNKATKRWQILPRNTVVNPQTNTIANTTTVFSYYVVVYPNGSSGTNTVFQPKVQESSVTSAAKVISKEPIQVSKQQTVKNPKPQEKKCFLFICW